MASNLLYSSAKTPAAAKGLAPVSSPYGGYRALNPYPATQSPADAYAAINPPAAPPDALSRAVGNGQNTFTPPTPRTPAAATPPTAPGTPPGGAPGQNVFDLSTDPIVQKIRALNTQNYSDAVAGADAQRKQALIGSGFGDLARATQFGSLEAPTTGDEATALAAQQNPFSTAAQLMHAHAQAGQTIDQNANDANLFYSSERGNQLTGEAQNYLQHEADAEGAVQQTLSQILQGLVGERSTERSNEENAIETARQNAISNAIAQGIKFVGYDANGNPIFDNSGTGGGGGTTAPPPVASPAPAPNLVTPAGLPAPNAPSSPAAQYALLNPPPPPPDVLARVIANGQNVFARPRGVYAV